MKMKDKTEMKEKTRTVKKTGLKKSKTERRVSQR